MNNRWLIGFCALLISAFMTSVALPAEKLKLATPIKLGSWFYLPILAAEEKGFWKEEGLEVEWFPFQNDPSMHRAIAAGAVRIGLDSAAALLPGIIRGVPAIFVSDFQKHLATALWVKVDSPIKEPKDLKRGARVGVTALGSTSQAYARSLLRTLGLEKEVRFVGTGGQVQNMAALKSGAIDATAMSPQIMAALEAKGEVLAIARQEDPQILVQMVWAHKDFLKANPEVISNVIKALLKSAGFVQRNQEWAVKKIEAMQGLPPLVAERVYRLLEFSTDGKISAERFERTRNFLIEYELISVDKFPPPETLYTLQFVR